jgi:hypothetical protein
MARFRDLPIRRKLMTGFMLTSLVALIITVGVFLMYDRATFRAEVLADTSVLAGIIGENASSSLVFNDPKGATSTLAALRAQPDVLAAHLFDPEGRLFASYSRSGGNQAPARVPADGSRIEPRMITVTKPVLFNGTRVGTVYLQSGLGALQERRELVPGQKMTGFECTIAVENIDQTIRAIEGNGGRLATPKFHIPTVGTVADFVDTEGNVAGICQREKSA